MYIEDSKLYCYLLGAYLKDLVQQPMALDALLDALDVPGKPPQLKRLAPAEKWRTIETHADYLTKSPTSLWRGVPPPEMIAAALWRSRLADKHVNEIFCAVKKEKDLLLPAAAWLRETGLTPYAEVPCGTKRVDVLGVKKGGFFTSDRVVAVELKNDVDQLKRGLDQMTTFGEYAHHVWLACTPAMAAEYLDAHASARSVHHWDGDLLNRKMRDFGFGLLIFYGHSAMEVVRPKERRPTPEKAREVEAALKGRAELP